MDIDVDFNHSSSWGPEMRDRLVWLRENDPIFWSEKTNLWVATRFADVCHISKNNEIFCSGLGVRPNNPVKLGLIDEDEPRHGQVRRLINRGFTPRMVKKLEVAFRIIVKEAIDSVAEKGECDFVESIAVPLPLLLIAEMIGIHKKDHDRFHRWSDHMIAGDGNFDNPEIVAKAAAAFGEYTQYCTKIIEDRRANPQDDLVSILVGAKDAGILVEFDDKQMHNEMRSEESRALGQDELIKLMVVLLVAGNETTRNGMSAGMEIFINHPEEREMLRQNPSLIPVAVEEVLRLASPIHSFSRTATRDTELHGKKIKKGDSVLMIYPSANRDPAQFEDPDTFKI
ncbi:MAG: cytochrome P450, partial [Deltaproteobacteria bacterium]|nr:cytochrome P450 [Deltaproteobacteria bacterium]